MKTPNLDLYAGMPNRTLLSAREVMIAFGCKHANASDSVKKNLIPRPVTRLGYIRQVYRKRRGNNMYWRLGDLRKLLIADTD